MNAQKIIIDSDPGVDDAVAIFMALAAHRLGKVKVMAITLVAGNTSIENSKVNVMRILETAGMQDEIPVYEGAKCALVHKYKNDEAYHGSDGFNEVQFPNRPDISKVKPNAVAAILRLVAENPTEIKLITLGPLTNIATCVIIDPDFAASLAGMVIMGGNSHGIGNVTSCAEFNFDADPEAAHVVINRCKMPNIKVVPWETCYNTYFDWSWRWDVLGKLDTPQMHLLDALEKKWFEIKPFDDQHVLCDQVTMACALYQDLIKESSLFEASVELGGSLTRGMMVLEKRNFLVLELLKTNKVEIIQSIDTEQCKKVMFDLLGTKLQPESNQASASRE